jgi:tetratricopeptide (TPR) repeat protein
VFLGVFLSLAMIELSLRLAGAIILYGDNLRNKKEVSKKMDKNTVNILCLGPCYTVGVGVTPENAYPNQLERILNQRNNGKKFSVINRGVRSKNLSFFVNNLEYLIKKCQPGIIILNVNDRVDLNDQNLIPAIESPLNLIDRIKIFFQLQLNDLKISRLVKLLWEPSEQSASQDDSRSKEEKDFALPGKESYYAVRIKNAEEAVEQMPYKAANWYNLGEQYAKHGLFDLAVEKIKKAAELSPGKFEYYNKLFWYYGILGEYDLAIEAGNKSFEAEPGKKQEIYKNIQKNEEKIKEKPWAHNLYSNLAGEYATIGEYEKAIEFMKKTISIDPVTVENYDKLIFLEKLSKRGNSGHSKKEIDKNLYFTRGNSPVFMDEIKDFLALNKVTIDSKVADGQAIFKRLMQYDLKKSIAITNKHKILFLLENTGTQEEQQGIIRQVCHEMNIPLADVYASLKNYKNPELLFQDSLSARFNNKGYEFLAQEIYRALDKNGFLERVEKNGVKDEQK